MRAAVVVAQQRRGYRALAQRASWRHLGITLLAHNIKRKYGISGGSSGA